MLGVAEKINVLRAFSLFLTDIYCVQKQKQYRPLPVSLD